MCARNGHRALPSATRLVWHAAWSGTRPGLARGSLEPLSGGFVVSCVIGVKAVFHNPTVPRHLGSAGAPDQHADDRLRQLAVGEACPPNADPVKTPTPAEGDRAMVAENLRRQRSGARDKQRRGTRSGTESDGKAGITNLPTPTDSERQDDLPPRGSRTREYHA
jgi:hypothetical protein